MRILLCFLSLLSTVLYGKYQDSDAINKCRYDYLRSFLDQYKRPFTMLEIGANSQAYSLLAAYDYQNSVCVMIQNDLRLVDVCKSQDYLNNIILLNMLSSPEQLQHLAECEHFDVTLAFDIVNQFKANWQEAIDVMLHLGDHLMIDVPLSRSDIMDYIVSKGGYILGEISSELDGDNSILYLIKSQNKYLQRKTWLRLAMKNSPYHIQSDFEQKFLYKPQNWPKGAVQNSIWLPGINLVTFKMCLGAYPVKEMLQEKLLEIKDDFHSDWLINNMIVQGNKLVAIDGDDDSCRLFFSEEILNAHQQLLRLDDPSQVEHYFWNNLLKTNLSRRQIIKFFSQIFPATALIFNVGLTDEVAIERYLGYGAKVIYVNEDFRKADMLLQKFKKDDFVVYRNAFNNQNNLLEAMISRYGIPKFCIINMPRDTVFEVLKTLLQPVPCIAFSFDIRFKSDLILCANYLASLGYKDFNFSVRDIFGFVLEPNKYIDTNKNWAHSVQELLNEINKYAQLDYDGQSLYGYIYARN